MLLLSSLPLEGPSMPVFILHQEDPSPSFFSDAEEATGCVLRCFIVAVVVTDTDADASVHSNLLLL